MNFNHVLVGDEQTATTHEGTRLAGWLGGWVAGWEGWCQACGVVGCRRRAWRGLHSSASFVGKMSSRT